MEQTPQPPIPPETGAAEPAAPAPERVEAPAAAVEPEAGPAPAPAAAAAAPARSLVYRLFSPETRLGRTLRPVVRWSGFVVGIFALGLLTAYLLLYLPTWQRLEETQQQWQQTHQQLSEAQAALAEAQQERDAARQEAGQSVTALKKANTHVALLTLINDITRARLALTAQDGAAARSALKDAEAQLKALAPVIEADDKELNASLLSRLELVRNEISRDPKTALSDLAIMADNIQQLSKRLVE